MKKIASLIISLCSVLLLIFLFVYYILFPNTFKSIFIVGIIFIFILILYNYLLIFGFSHSEETNTQDFFIKSEKIYKEVPETTNKKLTSFETIINEILYPLQMIETLNNFLSTPMDSENQEFAVNLIKKNLHHIKNIIGEKIYQLDEKNLENNIPFEIKNLTLIENTVSNISICIFGKMNNENLSLRLILQSYGFYVKLFDSSQETLSSIEDKLFQLLIVLPESENDESFLLCSKIREKFSLLDFPILILLNKYRSYLIEKSYHIQINDFLIRPFDVSALIARIQMLANYRELYLEKQKLLKSEQEKRAYLYFVTHNVNTPLTLLLNEMDELSSFAKSLKNDEMLQYINQIQENTNQINIIIQNVLNSYKLSDGKYLVNPEIINLKEFIANENKYIMQKAINKNQTFVFDAPKNVLNVFCDMNSLKGIYVNLVDNAIKYTQKNGIITVKIHCDEKSVFLSIIDNGQGIPKEKQILLFNRFANIGSKSTAKENSVGLGLYVVNELCNLNEIEIFYTENKECNGQGSIFTLKFAKIG